MITGDLEIAANIASIATAIVAVYAYGHFRFSRWRQRKRLEDYLWGIVTSPRPGDTLYERTIGEIVSALNMSEDDVLRAVHSSKNVYLRIERYAGDPLSAALRVSHIDVHAAATKPN